MKQKITIPSFSTFKVDTKQNSVYITDKNVFRLHKKKFDKARTIVVDNGEKEKTVLGAITIINQLKELKIDRSYTVIGVGGGVVLDVAAFVSNIYMRGVDFVAVPTTLLAMVDASIGGKNGINFGHQKNFIGTIKQPKEIIVDLSFLKTLPIEEWQNGFAEIIKHAAIKDVLMFEELEKNNITFYQKNATALKLLIQKNIQIKTTIVVKDVDEKGERKLLNFGHTLGHAIETEYRMSHGFAISIGMFFASKLSEKYFDFKDTKRIENLLEKYDLPSEFYYEKEAIFDTLKMDKKKDSEAINYILLKKIGKAIIHKIQLKELKKML